MSGMPGNRAHPESLMLMPAAATRGFTGNVLERCSRERDSAKSHRSESAVAGSIARLEGPTKPRATLSRKKRFILVAVPESHAGRLFDHVHLRVADVEASKRFYARALEPLGLGITGEGDGWFSADELFVSDDGPATSGLHVAFQAQDPETVDRFHAAAIEAGGRDNGAPGERSYHPGYYGAYVLDPDGTNVEAVYHGPVKRSTPSVVFSWDA
jgi:catechol 2,3-dioxygenase-like lactoylglutathione lyase family enzyme